ncbi:MAG: phosphate/phosphite/phosphonate ABC transporter substrate-binding protein [Gammaproteobacteria bacterium]|nr:phosphate/phosphite/phosphonate ABC transporter substrate-binding protein [Gammaproteobacteria bacterium]
MFRTWTAVWLTLLLAGTTEAARAESKSIAVGTLGDEPAKLIRTYQPIANYLAAQLVGYGITEGRVVLAKEAREMGEMMRLGKVDIFIDSPMPTIGVNHIGGGRTILRRWKGGVGEYRSVIFSRVESPIKSIADLRGKHLAFEQPFSSTGYILPRIIFEHSGESLVLLEAASATPPADKIGYVFSGDDENTMEWVLRRRVAAGAMSHYNVEKYAKTSLASLKIIWESPPIPRHLVSVRNDLAPEVVAAIIHSLTALDKTKEGSEILANFEKTSKFDPVPSQALELFEKYRMPVIELLHLSQ